MLCIRLVSIVFVTVRHVYNIVLLLPKGKSREIIMNKKIKNKKYRSLSFLPFKVPLRPTNLPLMSSMVLNGTERYCSVLNGIPLADFYKGIDSYSSALLSIYHELRVKLPTTLPQHRYQTWCLRSSAIC